MENVFRIRIISDKTQLNINKNYMINTFKVGTYSKIHTRFN